MSDATAAADMCPKCKGDNESGWALCPACAAQTEEQTQQAQELLNEIATDPVRRHKIWFLPPGHNAERRLEEQRQAIAYRIRAELVCSCRCYDKWNDAGPGSALWDDFHGDHALYLENIYPGHTLCYWGEAAARLAETFGDPEESESDG